MKALVVMVMKQAWTPGQENIDAADIVPRYRGQFKSLADKTAGVGWNLGGIVIGHRRTVKGLDGWVNDST